MTPALLFDLDGTMIVSDPIHKAVFKDLLAEFGVGMTDDIFQNAIHGRPNAEIFATLLPQVSDPIALADRKEAMFRARLPRPSPAMPGLKALVARAEAEGWPRAVVTNAMPANAEASLGAIGLADAFPVVVSGEVFPPGKPDPGVYIEAMRCLGVTPAQSIAFEDSASGIRAARAAGITTLGIRSTLDDTALRAAGAHASLADFTDPALEDHLAALTGAHP